MNWVVPNRIRPTSSMKMLEMVKLARLNRSIRQWVFARQLPRNESGQRQRAQNGKLVIMGLENQSLR